MRRLREQLAPERRGPCLTSELACLSGVHPGAHRGATAGPALTQDDVLYCQMQGQQTAAAGAQVQETCLRMRAAAHHGRRPADTKNPVSSPSEGPLASLPWSGALVWPVARSRSASALCSACSARSRQRGDPRSLVADPPQLPQHEYPPCGSPHPRADQHRVGNQGSDARTVIKHKIHTPVAAITTMTNPMPPLEVAITDALDALPATQRHPNTGSTAPIGTPTGCRPKALGVARHRNSRTILPFYQRWRWPADKRYPNTRTG